MSFIFLHPLCSVPPFLSRRQNQSQATQASCWGPPSPAPATTTAATATVSSWSAGQLRALIQLGDFHSRLISGRGKTL